MLSRLVMAPPMLSSTIMRSAYQQMPKRQQIFVRQFQKDSRETITRTRASRQTLREQAMAPPGPNGTQFLLFLIFFVI